MIIQNVDFGEVESEELIHLIEQFLDIFDDYKGSADLIVSVCERAIPLARMEKKWYLFFVFYNTLFLRASSYGDSRKAIKYAEQFFTDCANILPEASVRYSHTNITEAVMNGFSQIFCAYKSYHQITDQKLEEFISFYEKTSQRYGEEYKFHIEILEYGLELMDFDTAKRGYLGIKENPLSGTHCYICMLRQTLGYYAMTGQHEKARAQVKQVIHKRIPAKYRSAYDTCPISNSACQYRNLLNYYARFGERQEYQRILEEGAIQMENYTDKFGMNAEMAYHLAVSGRFPHMDTYLNMFLDEVKSMENGGRTYVIMRNMTVWSIYFKKLDKSGIHEIKLECDSGQIPEKNEDGLMSVKSLSDWCIRNADRLGQKFEEARKLFHYEEFKNNYQKCAGM